MRNPEFDALEKCSMQISIISDTAENDCCHGGRYGNWQEIGEGMFVTL